MVEVAGFSEIFATVVSLTMQFIDVVLHLDAYLNQLAEWMGPWLYAVLFLIIFCETGLVVTPFLPGDSLLFAIGALAATPGSPISIGLIWILLIVAGIIGDASNYAIGKYVGPKVFRNENSFWFDPIHLRRTEAFYQKHGGKTIILARFLPLLRTFAPFVAGIGHMKYSRFALFNVTGAFAWVTIFLALGYGFGNIPAVKKNFPLVIIGIIIVSVLPLVYEYVKAKANQQKTANCDT